jgi:hypothetical protein
MKIHVRYFGEGTYAATADQRYHGPVCSARARYIQHTHMLFARYAACADISPASCQELHKKIGGASKLVIYASQDVNQWTVLCSSSFLLCGEPARIVLPLFPPIETNEIYSQFIDQRWRWRGISSVGRLANKRKIKVFLEGASLLPSWLWKLQKRKTLTRTSRKGTGYGTWSVRQTGE